MTDEQGNGVTLAGDAAGTRSSYSYNAVRSYEPAVLVEIKNGTFDQYDGSNFYLPSKILADAIAELKHWHPRGEEMYSIDALEPAGICVNAGCLSLGTVRHEMGMAFLGLGEPKDYAERITEWLLDQVFHPDYTPPPKRRAVTSDGELATPDLAVQHPADCAIGDPRPYVVN